MAPSKVGTRSTSRHLHKPSDRHRRTYEQAGQIWPENLTKHLRLAALPNDAFEAHLLALRAAVGQGVAA